MKIILAQGNPGEKYAATRHNVGFMALDFYAGEKDLEFLPKPKFEALIAEDSRGDEKVLLVKPTTFYNDTGRCAISLLNFYKESSENLLVVHDETSLPFGTLRTRNRGSDAGNNGIKSLNNNLGEDYARIRVGTANELLTSTGSYDFVLSKFNGKEATKLKSDILPKVSELIDDFIVGNHQTTSHKL